MRNPIERIERERGLWRMNETNTPRWMEGIVQTELLELSGIELEPFCGRERSVSPQAKS